MEETTHTPGPWINTKPTFYSNQIWAPDGNKIFDLVNSFSSVDVNNANAELIAQAPDLLAKVSEQEKEIESLKEALRQLHLEQDKHKLRHVEIVSEQSQRIAALTEQVEKLKERCISFAGEVDELNRKYIDDTRWFREERKELVEANEHMKKLLAKYAENE